MKTLDERFVADYTKMPLLEVFELDILSFWFLLREAIIYFYSQTESGVEYLEKAWLLEQTEPDETTLNKKYGGENVGGKQY